MSLMRQPSSTVNGTSSGMGAAHSEVWISRTVMLFFTTCLPALMQRTSSALSTLLKLYELPTSPCSSRRTPTRVPLAPDGTSKITSAVSVGSTTASGSAQAVRAISALETRMAGRFTAPPVGRL